ncbi:MAG: DUF1820 family protein [Gammaproteobacteria bacterium]|nr:DUF1820 family protein [Gammaproteobacteria bacterium]
MAEEPHIYRVIFHNQGQIYEVFAREIFQSELMGFIEVEGYLFGSRTQMVVDPSEERLEKEFEGVERSYIPMHAIVRIDEVEKEGPARIKEVKGDKVMPFPTMPAHPRRTD